jgi:hypothetical protein
MPLVGMKLAKRIAVFIPEKNRLKVTLRALEWLCKRDEGLVSYNGVNGRQYTEEERRAIAGELAAVETLSCPFMDGETCMIGGLPRGYNRDETAKPPYLWLPTAMVKLLDEETLRQVVKNREVADAKVAMLSRNEALY